MGTVWPCWADLRGISGLLWWIGKNSGRLSTHSCVFVCFIMLWPMACLCFWLQPWTTFPSHWPHSSGSSRTTDSRNSKISERHESFQRNMILPRGLWERRAQTNTVSSESVVFSVAAVVWDSSSFINISTIYHESYTVLTKKYINRLFIYSMLKVCK